MSALETAGATRLRAINALTAILTGGIYEAGKLGTEGITSPLTTPAAYGDGKLRPCAIVKARARVPTQQIRDLAAQVADASQVLEVWLYERITTAAIEAALPIIYTALEGYAFAGHWPCAWAFSLTPLPAPEMNGVVVARIDFQLISVRRPIAA